MKKKINKKKKEIILLLIFVFILLIGLISSSYAIFFSSASSQQKDLVLTGELKLVFSDNSQNNININPAIPITDEAGLSTNPYTFDLENTGNYDADYKIKLTDIAETHGKSLIPKNLIKYSLNNSTPITLNNLNNSELDLGLIKKGETNNYTLRLWLDYSATKEIGGMHFHAKVEASAYIHKPAIYQGTDVAINNTNINYKPEITIYGKSTQESYALTINNSTTYSNGVNLGIPWNTTKKIETDISSTSNTSDYRHMIFSTWTSASGKSAPYIAYGSNNPIVFSGLVAGSTQNPSFNSSQYGDGVRRKITYTLSAQTSTGTIFFGAWSDSAWSRNHTVYGIKVWNTSDVLIRDMIPVPQGSTIYSNTPAPSNCLWDKISKMYYTNTGSTAFTIANAVSPDNSVEVINSGMGGNVFNVSTISSNKKLSSTGTEITDTLRNISDYIYVKGSINISLNLGSNYAFYDQNKNFISGDSTKSLTIFRNYPIPANAYYFRYDYQKDTVGSTLLRAILGDYTESNLPPYQTYTPPVNLVSGSKNIYSGEQQFTVTSLQNYNTGFNFSNNYRQYTFSCYIDNTNGTTTARARFSLRDDIASSWNYYYTSNILAGTKGISTLVIDLSNNYPLPISTNYFNFQMTGTNTVYSNLKLEIGGSATPYTPYNQVASSITSTLRSIQVPSASTNYTYTDGTNKYISDYIELKSGKVNLVRNIKDVIFNGTEDWTQYSTIVGDNYTMNFTDAKYDVDVPCLSSHFLGNISGSGTSYGVGNIWFQSTSLYKRLYIYSTYNTLNFKSWIQTKYAGGNPLIIYYQLDTPIISDITNTAEGQSLIALSSQKGYTRYYDDSNMNLWKKIRY